MLNTYKERLSQTEENLSKSVKQSNLISTIRLILGVLFVIFGYQYFQEQQVVYLVLNILTLIGFFILIKVHGKYQFQKKLNAALVRVNQEEIEFISKRKMPFDSGEKYLAPNHFYAHDLDIFGAYSLYQYVNRTQLKIGADFLSDYLLKQSSIDEIKNRQEAILELNDLLDWRQNYTALSITTNEQENTFATLGKWAKIPLTKPLNWIRILAFVLPALLFICMGLNYLAGIEQFGRFIQPLVIINLLVAFSQVRFIKNELVHSDNINNTFKSYSLLIEQIENQPLKSKKLTELKSKLQSEHGTCSQAIHELSKIYSQLENMINPFGAIFFNALFMYHVHALYKLKVWKKLYAKNIAQWIEVIGELEALNSLSNFSTNNPQFVFPSLNSEEKVEFSQLGHPLLPAEKRVDNDINYNSFKYIILTGSNMSGKSTFLRSLGINMVLAQAGAPVCAKEANIHPMPILVSMRVNDSLGEGESFFFAEVKRLKQLMQAAEKATSFVLLDEILRGTNSDDKRTGTVEVIKSIIQKNALGAIATHDLKVCDTTQDFPGILSNKCFEVKIEDNELVFDYSLRDGVCKNKSATFLMKKMGVI